MLYDIKQFSKILLNTNPIDRLLILGLFLFPFSISTGPLLPELILIIMSILLIYNSIKFKIISIFNSKILFLFILFCFYLIVRSLLSIDPYLSLESSLFYFRFFFLILIFEYILSKYDFFLKYFFYILTLTCALIILKQIFLYYSYSINDSFISIFLSSDTLDVYKFNANNRMPRLFDDELVTGSYLSRLFPFILSISLFLLQKKLNSMIYIFSLLFIFGFTIFISGERSAFINFIFISLMFVIFCRGWRIPGLIFFTVTILLFSISHNYVGKCKHLLETCSDNKIEKFIFSIDNKMIKKTLSQINFNATNLLEIYLPHKDLYKTSYNIYKDNKLFGVAPKIFRKVCSDENYKHGNGCSTHPHNILLQFLSETGLLGFLFYIMLIGSCALLLIKNLYLNIFSKSSIFLENHTIILLAGILMNLNPLIPSGNLFNNWLNLLYYLPIGFLIFFFKNKKNV